MRPGEVTSGKCKCGRKLVLEWDLEGWLTSHHEPPLCDAYSALVADLLPPVVTVIAVREPEPD